MAKRNKTRLLISEQVLQSELHLAIVEPGSCDLAESGPTELRIGRAELWCVPDVEHLIPELQTMAFDHRKFLEQAQVPHLQTRLPESVAPQVAVLEIGELKCCRLEPARGVRVVELRILPGNVIGPLRGRSRALPVALLSNREREARLIRHNAVERPVLQQNPGDAAPAGRRRHIPQEAADKAMAVIKP